MRSIKDVAVIEEHEVSEVKDQVPSAEKGVKIDDKIFQKIIRKDNLLQ